jgi:probable HAF family extracellular repeat protein
MLVVLFVAAFAAAQSYTVTDLGPSAANAINSLGDVVVQGPNGNSFVWTPSGSVLALLPLPGDSSTTPNGINRQGLAVGSSSSSTESVAVLWTNGVPVDLGTLGGTYSVATGINASGEVAGYSDISSGSTEAFVWSKATGMQGLGLFTGGDYSLANAINRFGQVAGYADLNGGNPVYAFIWSKTTGMRNLGRLPGYTDSFAYAINDLGQVAGDSSVFGARPHATLWGKAKGSMLDLGLLPGARYSTAAGINNVGQVVGLDSYADYSSHAFVWNPSTGMLDLNNLIPANSGWVLEFATAINDQGQIVGFGTLNGQGEAFLLTPQ